MIEQQSNPFFEPNRWSVTSVSVKAVFIGILIIVLLIPSILIQNLVGERQQRSKEVQDDISQTWSGSQTVQGPVLCIPYQSTETYADGSAHQVTRIVTHKLYVLPQETDFDAGVNSEARRKGIFEFSVYNAAVKIKATFKKPDLAGPGMANAQLLPEQATLLFTLADAKGLKNLPVINADGQQLTTEFKGGADSLFGQCFAAAYNATNLLQHDAAVNFTLNFKGSNQLYFMPLGKSNTVNVRGNWPAPSFEGAFAADTRKVTAQGFTAAWHTLSVSRPLPQQWRDDDVKLNNKLVDASSYGVRLVVPVDDYQKTMRTSKYAILIIVLSFAALFLTEVIGKHSIHTFNYMLMGAAMIVYYTLLLSFSEQIGFNAAYAVASVATVGLITWFIASLLKNGKAAALFSFIISVIYVFIFVIIQLEDLALMVGSIALFIIVGILMYFSRKINWSGN